MTDVKSTHEGTCYCGTFPREEYGARCPSCAAIVPEPERQYWLTARETEWLRQHVPVAQWPPGWLEYWLGVRVEGVQQENLASGTWGTGAPSAERLRELASEPSWADRTDPSAGLSGCALCDDPDNSSPHTEHVGTRTAPPDAGPDTGTVPDAPGPHPKGSSAVRDALRNEDLDLFVSEAGGSGISPGVATAAWALLEQVNDRLEAISRAWTSWLEDSDAATLAGRHPDAYLTAIAAADLARIGLEYLVTGGDRTAPSRP